MPKMLFGANELYKHVSPKEKKKKVVGVKEIKQQNKQKIKCCQTQRLVMQKLFYATGGKAPCGLLKRFSTRGLSYIMNTSNMDKSHYDFSSTP